MNALGFSPLRPEINVGVDDQSVFACQDLEELTTYSGIFKVIPNYNQLNHIALDMFFASWGAY